MKRRLVKQGNGALTITLPFKWLENNNLSKGDYLELLESGRDLIISVDKELINKEQEIEISKERPFFKRYLKSCYILGYDKLEVFSKEKLPIELIKKAMEDLIGYEITELTATRCVIIQIASFQDEGFDIIMRRIFFMISSMFDDIINSLSNLENMKDIALTEESINRLVNYCLRVLNKQGYKEFKKTQYIYQIIVGLENIGDYLRDFCLGVSKNDGEVEELLLEMKSYYEDFSQLFFKYDMKKIQKIKQKRIDLYKKSQKLISSYPHEVLYLYQILGVLHQLEVAVDPINS